MQKVFFKTFGCRTNAFDTQVMINALKDFVQTPYEEDSDIDFDNLDKAYFGLG